MVLLSHSAGVFMVQLEATLLDCSWYCWKSLSWSALGTAGSHSAGVLLVLVEVTLRSAHDTNVNHSTYIHTRVK